MYGRLDAGHSCTTATHQPPAASVVRPSSDDVADPAREPRRAREEVDETERGQDEERLHLLGEEAEADERARRDDPAQPAVLERARHRVRGGDEQQHQQRVGVVEAEHQRGDGREREHRARDQRGGRREPALDRREEDADRGDTFERLRDEHAPRVHAEDAARDLHDPQRRRRLVDGDEVRRVGRTEEERLPALRARPAPRRSSTSSPNPTRRDPTGTSAAVTASSTSSAGRTQAGSVSGPRHSRSTRDRSPLGRRRRRVARRRAGTRRPTRGGLMVLMRRTPWVDRAERSDRWARDRWERRGRARGRAARTARATARRTTARFANGSAIGTRRRRPVRDRGRDERAPRPSTRRARRATAPRTARSRDASVAAARCGPTPSAGWRSTTARCRSSTATTLADPAGTPAPSASATRTAALSRVVPTETRRQRDIRCTIARHDRGIGRP